MLDVLTELQKYQKIELEDMSPTDFYGTVPGSIVNRIADDINRISKNHFRLEQQFEDFSEEILEILREELNIAETYKKWVSSRDDLLVEFGQKVEEGEKKTASLVMALISLKDAIETVYKFILSSGETDWIRQMERLMDSVTLVMLKNNLLEIGNEKYFDDILHEAVSTVQEQNLDFREIVSVERKGYSYMDKIVRKASVVVNNFRKDENGSE